MIITNKKKTIRCVLTIALVSLMLLTLAGCGGIKAGTYYYCAVNGNLIYIIDEKTCDVTMTPIKGTADNMAFKNCNYTIEDDKLTVTMPLSSVTTSDKNPFKEDITLKYDILDKGDKIKETESGSEYSIISADEANSILSRNKTNSMDFKTNTVN